MRKEKSNKVMLSNSVFRFFCFHMTEKQTELQNTIYPSKEKKKQIFEIIFKHQIKNNTDVYVRFFIYTKINELSLKGNTVMEALLIDCCVF